jgi:hypothetical protein
VKPNSFVSYPVTFSIYVAAASTVDILVNFVEDLKCYISERLAIFITPSSSNIDPDHGVDMDVLSIS